MSLTTLAPVPAMLSALDVGMPRWYIASLPMNSRMEDLMTALPSAMREYGVLPAPLSCNSHFWPFLPSTSPRLTTRPSPSCPAGAEWYHRGTLLFWAATDVTCWSDEKQTCSYLKGLTATTESQTCRMGCQLSLRQLHC